MNSILLIEDESSVANFIRKGLVEQDYRVSVALTGSAGIDMAINSSYDLIILDIMLPEISGIEVCKEIRKRKIMTPVLFLTALGTPENVAHGLDMGGDDYLVKPFKFIELNARIKALLRRADAHDQMKPARDNLFVLGGLVMNDDTKTVERDGDKINLTATEYRLLLVLVKNKGRVLSRVDLLEAVWDVNYNMGTNVVDVYINYLRKKIDTNREHKMIQTVIGMGYVLKEA